MNILVSACLLGIKCRYDGSCAENEKVKKLQGKYNIIPICPEIYGGLKTPREPSEIVGNKVLTKSGEDVTANYHSGAQETLKLAKLTECKYAVLQDRSPSCGYKKIYDGTFSGNLIDGNGIAADLFIKNGIQVLKASEVEELL